MDESVDRILTPAVAPRPRSRTTPARKRLGPVLATAFALLPAMATGDVEVRVIDGISGKPLAYASVCLGTPADIRQFGARHTSPEGVARFRDTPRTHTLVTVSREGYMGFRALNRPRDGRLLLPVSLQPGGLGPSCPGPESADSRRLPAGLHVTALQVVRRIDVAGDAVIDLAPSVHGTPTDYRISEHPDFLGAPWLTYANPIRYVLNHGPRPVTLYFQVRRSQSGAGATLESVSDPISRTVYPR